MTFEGSALTFEPACISFCAHFTDHICLKAICFREFYPPAHVANPFQPPGAWTEPKCDDESYTDKDDVEDDDEESALESVQPKQPRQRRP